MRYLLSFGVACLLLNLPLISDSEIADSKEEGERLSNARMVLKAILDTPDEGIPSELLNKAECVLVFPGVKKGAFLVGASYGKGAMVCRSGIDFTEPWSSPAMYRLASGSIGFQIGGSSTDYVLLVMNPSGVKSLLGSKVKLGADATAAAGPKGRSAEAATDAAMGAEILAYARSKGLFAGVSLKGGTLRQDNGANKDLYGRKISAKEIVLKKEVSVPKDGKPLVDLLKEVSPKNLSK